MREIIRRLKHSSLFRDSFWAVGGNGMGNVLMLLSGILIARILGKDLYGEYGMVKTTMFYLALFSTFALGDTSTKFIAEYVQKDSTKIRGIIKASLSITLATSITMCVALLVFAQDLADYIEASQLCKAFRFLGIIIVFRALGTVGNGLLGGFKEYRRIGMNNIIAGSIMLLICVPSTRIWGLDGALGGLLLSQMVLSVLNLSAVAFKYRCLDDCGASRMEMRLLSFSYPFALNELVYTLAGWGTNLLLTKYASIGDLGMYSACNQWKSIILFMPSLLGNVILSYLSTSATNSPRQHSVIIKRMLLVNLVCTIVPFVFVFVLSGYITDYYGPTFAGMQMVLNVIVFGTVFTCLSRVFQSNLMSEGKKWTAFGIRSFYNILQLILVYLVLTATNGQNAALNMAYISVFINFFALLLYAGEHHVKSSNFL